MNELQQSFGALFFTSVDKSYTKILCDTPITRLSQIVVFRGASQVQATETTESRKTRPTLSQYDTDVGLIRHWIV